MCWFYQVSNPITHGEESSMAQEEIDTAEILRGVVEKESQFKTTVVQKAVDVDLDVGSLLVIDTNPVNERLLR